MKNFNKDRGGFKSRPFGGGGGGRGFGDSNMHQATCSDCGRSCEVPFRPAPGKPVYCKNCFKKDEDFEPRRESRGFGSGGGNRFEERRTYQATCAECGDRCEVPFKPTGEKPVYCSNCFASSKGDRPKTGGKPAGASSEQFDQMNAKLDRILKTLDIIQGKKEFIVEKPASTEKPFKEVKVPAKEAKVKVEPKPKKAPKAVAKAKPKKAKK